MNKPKIFRETRGAASQLFRYAIVGVISNVSGYLVYLFLTHLGTTPINSELYSHFRQNTRGISVHYVKGDMPQHQLPWSQVLDSKDASVQWAVSADNAEILLQILQAPPGNGYVVLYLQQRY